MQRLQEKQGQAQYISPREKLYRIVTVETLPDDNDPTLFYLNVTLANAARRLVPISITFTVPDVVALDSTGELVVNPYLAGLSDVERELVFRR